jgi:capsular exopolysaccharide synthesis family protein
VSKFYDQFVSGGEVDPAPPKLLNPTRGEIAPARESIQVSSFSAEDDSVTNAWRVLRRRKWPAIGFFVIVVGIVSVVSFLMTPKYEAVGRIVFSRQDPDVLGLKDAASSRGDDLDYAAEIDTQVRILQSDTLAEAVIGSLHLADNPAFAGKSTDASQPDDARKQEDLLGIFGDNLSVAKDKNTRLIDIQFTSPDPRLAAQVVNTLTNAYIEHNFRTKFDATTQTSQWLAMQLGELQKKVETSQEALVQYQKEHGIVGVDDKQNVITETLGELNREFTTAQADRMQKEVSYRIAQSGNAELIKSDSNGLIEKLRAQQAELQDQYAKASVQLGPAHPKVLELQNEIKQNQDSIAAEVANLQAKIRNEYLAADEREKMVRAALESQKQAASQLNENAIQYNLLKRDVDSNRELYESLLRRLKEAGVTAGLKSSNIEVVDPARIPTQPAKPDIPRNIALAILFGLVGGVVLAFVQERFDTTVRTTEQIEVLSRRPALAIVPQNDELGATPVSALQGSSASESVELITYSRPASVVAEAYRSLLNSLLLSTSVPPRVILVTSPLPGEGKTTTSMNLAIALARQDKRVLLVDVDLRKPSNQKPPELQSEVGLGELLSNPEPRSPILRSRYVQNLFILPAGHADLSHAELISSPTMHRLMARWGQEFDHVILDCPPVLVVSDAVRVAADSDAVVLVVRSGRTTREAFNRAQSLLRQVGANLAGVVLNQVDPRSPEFSVQYGYMEKYSNAS